MGRYAERVYLALHLLRKHYDVMIDEDCESYKSFCFKMGITNKYSNGIDFMKNYLNDGSNPESIIVMLERVHDNAMVIREEITSETLSYVELSILFMQHAGANGKTMEELQTVTDYMLAFWGSVDERIENKHIRNIVKFGKFVESADLHIRFNYAPKRIQGIFERIIDTLEKEYYICNEIKLEEAKSIFYTDNFNKTEKLDKTLALDCINNLFSS
ncbi:MAG: hypothetical protein AUK44_02965 [Porphyromonadaceae bacterium CG2_30_38_12]|nr:MAG: hypothetical protein AUK44_02965 [Porphyromonadaceae bacterium CG2_30_38_12]